MDTTARRRRALSTALAFVLAIESVSAVAAAASVAASDRPSLAGATGVPAAVPAQATRAVLAERDTEGTLPASAASGVAAERRTTGRPASSAATAAVVEAAPRRVTSPSAAGLGRLVAPSMREHAPRSRDRSGATTGPASYRGRNHLWIPSLGINRSVAWFPCDRQRPPDNYVYRWGCAGSNNVYLMGHASSVFRPLHDAYVSGRLHRGMQAIYADAGGRVRTYTVRWWKLVRPTTSASWAWASLGAPSMTLQTCVGSRSQYRLMVRLVVAGR